MADEHVRGDPAQRVVGRLRVDVACGPIARMFPATDWQREENQRGGAVFEGRAAQVVENVPREPEPGSFPSGLFNLDAHIFDAESGHPVPYLDVRVTVRRGNAILLDQVPLVPVARPYKGVAGLHYGNNVALDPHGQYHADVTISPTALTGTNQPEVLAFVLDFD